MENVQFHKITPVLIEKTIANLSQITFEVTDICNLKCKYCGYGEFYDDYDAREGKLLDVDKAKLLLDYLAGIWSSSCNSSFDKMVYISFYGGEPLVNMSFIKEIVGYVNELNVANRKFVFSMTTNALLLDRYIDYLIEHNFNLLISLDGDESNNSYRMDHDGRNSYDRIVRNIGFLQNKYPNFFEERVNFNAVLHNKNSVDAIYSYFKSKYNKIPLIGELNATGIRKDKVELFERTYRNYEENLGQSENYEKIEREMFLKTASSQGYATYLRQYSGYVFKSYSDLLFDTSSKVRFPTGTCLPFGKKMFVTVNGKILPCERIGHQHALGEITNVVKLNLDEIAQKYNAYFDKLTRQCSKCHNVKACIQCIFNINDLDGDSICYGYMSSKDFERYVSNQLAFQETFPEAYYNVLRNVEVE